MSRKTLHKKAEVLLRDHGKFLLLFDVIDSKKWMSSNDWTQFYSILWTFVDEVTKKYASYLASGEIGWHENHTFRTIVGDGGGGFFSDIRVVDEIPDFAKKKLPFKLRWAVAEDEWDDAVDIIR